MTALELIEFPADRTLAEAREDWLTVVSGPINLSAGLRESPARALALAVMLIFARFTDQTRLQLRAAVAEDADQPLVFVADVAPELPLSEALRRTRAEAGPAPAPVVNIVLEGASARWSGDTEGAARLRFDVAGDELTLTFVYDAVRIAAVTARDFLEKIAVVLAALEARPDLAFGDLELIGAEARALLPDLARRIETRPYRAVAAQFFDAAARHGDQPAVTNGPHTYLYADLSAAVRVLTGQLREAGVQPGDVVAVSGLSSFGMLAGMLAVLTAGGVLVTLDRSLPEARQDLIRQVSDPRLVIEVGPATDGAMGGTIRCVDWPMADQIARLHAAAPPLAAVMVEPAVDAAAYIFFTSGSTGLPKGVLGSQLGLAHFLTWQRENFPIGPGDRASQLTALSFDVVLRDVLFPLTSGACLHIPARELVLDARRMLGWIEGNRITVMHAVPSLMKAWLQAHLRGMPFASLRYVFFAGEPLTDTLLRQVRQVASEQAIFVNLYGPTETTLAKLSHQIDRVEPGVQPVGLPQPGAEVVILRDRRLRCGLWEVGEIAIRTPYRSKGYFRNEALTDSVFLPNPQGGDLEDRLYMTGDLGRVRSDGRVEIFGRSDSQIKIRGVRIEPIEIEGLLMQQPGIKDAAITTRPAPNDGKQLLALVVTDTTLPEEARRARVQALREALMAQLHPAMVPSRILFAESLPYLPNGKCDRKAIAAMELDLEEEAVAVEATVVGLSEAQRRLVAGLGMVLNRPIVDLDKSFIEMGGDSLSYVQASMLVEDHLGHLPDHWERKPFRALMAQPLGEVAAQGLWTGMDATMVLRTIAIIFVCLSHTPTGTAIAATSALFVASGMNFARFLRPATQRSGDVSGTVGLILKIMIPAGLWQAMREIAAGDFWLPDLFLLGTFFQNPDNPHFTFWYLDVLAANLVCLCLIALVAYAFRPPAFRGKVPEASFLRDLLWLIIGVEIAILQVQTGFGDGIVGLDSVAPFKWFWMLALGVAITSATGTWQKLLLSGGLVALGFAMKSGVPVLERVFFQVDWFFFTSVAVLIWVDRVPVPRWLQQPIVIIASSTLFIYIVNYSVIMNILPKLHAPDWWVLQVAVAIAVGVAVSSLWDRASRIVVQQIVPALRRGEVPLIRDGLTRRWINRFPAE